MAAGGPMVLSGPAIQPPGSSRSAARSSGTSDGDHVFQFARMAQDRFRHLASVPAARRNNSCFAGSPKVESFFATASSSGPIEPSAVEASESRLRRQMSRDRHALKLGGTEYASRRRVPKNQNANKSTKPRRA